MKFVYDLLDEEKFLAKKKKEIIVNYSICITLIVFSLLTILISVYEDTDSIYSLIAILILAFSIYCLLNIYTINEYKTKEYSVWDSENKKNTINLFKIYNIKSLSKLNLKIPYNEVNTKDECIDYKYIDNEGILVNGYFLANTYYWNKDFFKLEVKEDCVAKLYIPISEDNNLRKYDIDIIKSGDE